jgi:hypothetical protein
MPVAMAFSAGQKRAAHERGALIDFGMITVGLKIRFIDERASADLFATFQLATA